MNQKDYKAIAEIIKERTELKQCDGIDLKGLRLICKDAISRYLADYFEKEELPRIEEDRRMIGNNARALFNKQQFLKDCGVDK